MHKTVETSKLSSDEILILIKKELCSGTVTSNNGIIYYHSPLLDFTNDQIELRIEINEEGKIIISDDNRTVMTLLSSGFDPFSTKLRESMMDNLSGSCAVNFQKYGEVSMVLDNIQEIGQKVFWMLHAIQRITASVMTGRVYRPQSFKKDVSSFLTEKRISFKEDPIYTIGKKIKARIDFVSVFPERTLILRAMSYSSTPDAITYSEKFIYESEILNKEKGYKFFPIAIIDDSAKNSEEEEVFNEDVMGLLQSIKTVRWSEKNSLIEVFNI
jgi:hypothetical protein